MLTALEVLHAITNSDLNIPCIAWHPYGKLGLLKTEVIDEGNDDEFSILNISFSSNTINGAPLTFRGLPGLTVIMNIKG